jgi:GxxExxY protein
MNLEPRNPGKEFGNTDLTRRIIAAGILVHTELGPGYLETAYGEAMALELREAGLFFERQKLLPIFYREHIVGQHRLDLVVENAVIVELKAISDLENIHFAILRSYLKASNLNDGLLLNFATTRLTVKRVGREYRPSADSHSLDS